MVSLRSRVSWMLPVLSALLLAACDGGGGGGGGDGGSGGAPSCEAMHDDPAASEGIDFVVTNDRAEPVYLSWKGCSVVGWSVDGKGMFDPGPPTCEGLLVGEPGVNDCAPVFEELAAGASITVPWHGRSVESIPVVAGCPDPPDDAETCNRLATVPDGSHELKIEIFLEYDVASDIPSSPTQVTASFDLPAASIPVSIAP